MKETNKPDYFTSQEYEIITCMLLDNNFSLFLVDHVKIITKTMQD